MLLYGIIQKLEKKQIRIIGHKSLIWTKLTWQSTTNTTQHMRLISKYHHMKIDLNGMLTDSIRC